MKDWQKNLLILLAMIAAGTLAYCDSRDYVKPYPYLDQP